MSTANILKNIRDNRDSADRLEADFRGKKTGDNEYTFTDRCDALDFKEIVVESGFAVGANVIEKLGVNVVWTSLSSKKAH